jgi:hypothetical protein
MVFPQGGASAQSGAGGVGLATAVTADVNSLQFPGFVHDGPCCQPVSGARLVDTFGAPRSGGRRHEGIDIFADSGTPIHAITGGTIVQGFDGGNLGGVVVRIQGDDGRYYYYAHLKEGSTDHLEVGQRINAGEVIGGVGNTGNAATTPAHLHFQVREDGEWINPFEFIKNLPDAEEILTGAGVPGASETVDPFAIDRGAPPSVADTDSDGLTDPFEQMFGTSASDVDSDDDGLSDAYETATSHTDPLSVDTDRDGLTDANEIAAGSDAGRAAVPEAARAAGFGGLSTLDTDSDGLSDAYEGKIGTNATAADSDADGLSDAFEVAKGTSATSADSDNDGLTDGFESAAGTLEPVSSVPGAAAAGGSPIPGTGALGEGAIPGAGVPGGGLTDDSPAGGYDAADVP